MTLPNYIQKDLSEYKRQKAAFEELKSSAQPWQYPRATPEFTKNIPPGYKWFSNADIFMRIPEKEGYKMLPADWAYGMIRQFQYPNQAYFAQDPKRLAKLYYMSKVAPPDWEAPGWYDKNAYQEAFDYVASLQGTDWASWDAFKEDDPVNVYLSSLPEPPPSFRLDNEKDLKKRFIEEISNVDIGYSGLASVGDLSNDQYQLLMDYLYENPEEADQEQEISPFMQAEGGWENLEPWQQVAMSIFSPQPMQNRPEWTRATAAGFQGLQAGLGGAAAAGAIIGATGGSVVPGLGTAIGALAGATVGYFAYRQAMTGEEIPIINNLLMVLDYPAQFTEAVIGTIWQAADGETKEVLANLPAAYKAGSLTYEASPIGTIGLNWLSGGAQVLEGWLNKAGANVELSSGMKADWKAGETWYLERAIANPTLIEGGIMNGEALDYVRSEIASGESWEALYSEFISKFGFSGTVGDFVAQSVLDPMNIAPWIVNKIGQGYGQITNNPNMKAAFTENSGLLGLDILPFGVQQIGEILARKVLGRTIEVGGKKYNVKGSGGIFDAMKIWKGYLRTGTLPHGYWLKKMAPVDVTLGETNPLALNNSWQAYSQAIENNMTFNPDLELNTVNMDAAKAEFRTYLENTLRDNGVDVSSPDYQADIDSIINELPEVESQAAINNPGKSTEERFNYINKAIDDFMFENTMDMISGTRQQEVEYRPPMTPFEKKLANLTEGMEYAELKPDTSKITAKNWLNKLSRLDKASQAIIFMDLFHTNMAGVLELGQGNPVQTASIILQAAGIDPVTVGKVGEAMINSPATHTVAPALKAFVDSGTLQEMLTVWTETAEQRTMLYDIANAVEESKVGKILELIDQNPEQVIQMIRNTQNTQGMVAQLKQAIDQGTLTPEALKQIMDPFLGTNAAAWNTDMWSAELLNSMGKFLDKFLVDYYDIKPKSWVFRLSDALKSAQSLVVLGFNPLYMVYNYVNNISTRAAQGVFGFMTKGQIEAFWGKMGIKPAYLDVGIGLEARPDLTTRGGQAIARALQGDNKDFISKIHKISKKASHLGIFSTLAAKIEVNESRQATTIGTMQMMSQLWKEGVGYTEMPPALYQALADVAPSLPDRIYSIINQGFDISKIIDHIYSESKYMGMESVLNRAVDSLYENAPERARDMMDKTGIKQELIARIGTDPTEQDVIDAYEAVRSRLQSRAEEAHLADLVSMVEDSRNRILSEGWSAMMPMWAEMWTDFTMHQLDDLVQNGITAEAANNARARGDWQMARKLWKVRLDQEEFSWHQFHDNMLATTKGMIDAVGTTNPDARSYVSFMGQWMDQWESFYAQKRIELNSFFDTAFDDAATREAAWTQTQKNINELYNKHRAIEQNLQTQMWEMLASVYESTSNRPGAEVLAWGQQVGQTWDEIATTISEFREGLANTNTMPDEVAKLFQTLNTSKLRPLISQRLAVMVGGALELAGREPVRAGEAPQYTSTEWARMPLDQKQQLTGGEGYTPEVQPTPEPVVPRVVEGTNGNLEINPDFEKQSRYTLIKEDVDKLIETIELSRKNADERFGVNRNDRKFLTEAIANVFDGDLEKAKVVQKLLLGTEDIYKADPKKLAWLTKQYRKGYKEIRPAIAQRLRNAYEYATTENVEAFNDYGWGYKYAKHVATSALEDFNNRVNKLEEKYTTYQVSDKQRHYLAGLLSEVFPNDAERHIIQQYFLGTKSVMTASPYRIKAMLDLLTTDIWGIKAEGLAETRKADLYRTFAYAAGQYTIDDIDTKPSQLAPDADKAEYNSNKIQTEQQKAAQEQALRAEAKMVTEDLKTALLDAGYTKEHVKHIMALLEVHAKTYYDIPLNEYISKRFAALLDAGVDDQTLNTLYQGGIPLPKDRSLIALHRISPYKLFRAVEAGGMAAPSIAITQPDIDYGDYGDIVFVGNRNLVDPEVDPRNKVWNADVFSPRTPDTERLIMFDTDKLAAELQATPEPLSGESIAAITDSIKNFMQKTNYRADKLIDRWIHSLDTPERETLFTNFTNDLIRSGQIELMLDSPPYRNNPETFTKNYLNVGWPDSRIDIGVFVHAIKPMLNDLQDLLKKHKDLTPKVKKLAETLILTEYQTFIDDYYLDYYTKDGNPESLSQRNRHLRDQIKAYEIDTDKLIQDVHSRTLEDFELAKAAKSQDPMASIQRLLDDFPPDKAQILRYSIGQAFGWESTSFSYNLERAAIDYLRAVERLMPAETYFLNPKTNELVPATVKNLTLLLTDYDDIRGQYTDWLGSSRGMLTREIMSIDEMHQYENNIVDYNEFDDYVDQVEMPAYYEALKEIQTQYPDVKKGDFTSALHQYIRRNGSDLTTLKDGLFPATNTARGIQLTPDMQSKVIDFIATMVDAPTQYYEAKPQRVVNFGEWSYVLYPKGLAQDAKNIINDLVAKYPNLKTYEFDNRYGMGRADAIMEFLDSDPNHYDVLFQQGEEAPRGSVDFLEDGRAVVRLFESRDISTMVHEIAHIFRRELTGEDLEITANWLGFTDPQEYADLQTGFYAGTLDEAARQRYIDAEERFAYGFERYLYEDYASEVAPPAMIQVFRKFAQWLRDIYHKVTGSNIDVEISPEMRKVYDRLLFDERMMDTRAQLTKLLDTYPTGEATIATGVDSHADYNVQYKVVELEKLVTSHDINFKLNKLYPQELQGRFRDMTGYINQVNEIIAKFNPREILHDTGLIDFGTPVIGPDMAVESGNGRTIALKTMAARNPEKIAAYVEALKPYLKEYGFEETAIDGFEYPVLVRQRLDDVDRVAFAADSNAPRKAEAPPIEKAVADAAKWSPELLAGLEVGTTLEIEDVILSPNNKQIIQNFINQLPAEELSGMIGADGEFTRQAIDRIKLSMMARLFNTPEGLRLIQLFGEATDPLVRNFQRSIESTMGYLAKLEGLVEDGRRPAEYSLAGDIADVVTAYLKIKETGMSYEDWLQSKNAFVQDNFVDIGLYPANAPEDIASYKRTLMSFFQANRRGVKAISEWIRLFADSVIQQPEMDQMALLDMGREPKASLSDGIINDLVRRKISKPLQGTKPQATLFQAGVQQPQQPTQPALFGQTPPAGTPVPRYDGRIGTEAYTETLLPLLNKMERITLDDMRNGQAFSLGDLDENTNAELMKYLNNLREPMASTKLASMRYGENMRNRALLNYRRRRNIDSFTQMIFPYEFWYTRSMMEWGKRMIEKPAWFAMYARIREHQQRMEQEGIPSRLKDKMRILAPFLPDWMGNAVYMDPLNQIFPFAQFATPFNMTQQIGENVMYNTVDIIKDRVKNHEITAKEAQMAIETKEGPIWAEAYAQSQVQNQGDLNPMSLASMMMTPAMWWTYPYHMINGTQEKLYPLPMTRTGQAMRSWGGPLGVIGNILATPEEAIRRKFNLSAYGEWGDYYIDRILSNMAGTNRYPVKDILAAMIERKGPIYDEAVKRTEQELALKMPGSLTAEAIKNGKLGGILYSLPATLFPGGILPEGELIQRGLKEEYSKAWDDYNAGNPQAINQFYADHPEYEARLALFDDPAERLRNFLVDEIWDKWHKLDSMNKPMVVDQLGQPFETMFLNKETQDYTAIDNETLAYWAQLLGGYVPDTDETVPVSELPIYKQGSINIYRPEVIQEVQQFYSARDAQYPNYKVLNDMYWGLAEYPKSLRSNFLKQHPELAEAWDWKDAYYDMHPLVELYMDNYSQTSDNKEANILYTTPTTKNLPDIQEQLAAAYGESMNPALQMQIAFAYYSGQEITGAARELLYNDWLALGSPGGTIDEFARMVLEGLY